MTRKLTVLFFSRVLDVCDVTLSVYPHRTSLKKYAWPRWKSNLYDLWNAIAHFFDRFLFSCFVLEIFHFV